MRTPASKVATILLIALLAVAIHESLHVYIYSRFGVGSSVDYWPFPPRTTPDPIALNKLTDEQMAQMDFLHTLNEVLTYPIFLGLCVYVAVKK